VYRVVIAVKTYCVRKPAGMRVVYLVSAHYFGDDLLRRDATI
jgi:hypothetical protein